MSDQGHIKIPLEIYEEIKDGPNDADKDLLYAWIQNPVNKSSIILNEDVDILILQEVIDVGYANNLTDIEIEQMGRDPFLIAYAKSGNHRCVVTHEVSKPSKQRHKRHIPDLCKSVNVHSLNPFELNKNLGFSTNWHKII